MLQTGVCASEVFSTSDLAMRPTQDLCEIVGRFAVATEGRIGHWVEYAKGVLLFVMAGDDHSGEFYIYDRKTGSFWLLELPDGVYGGYAFAEMKRKMQQFRLLELADNPGQLRWLSVRSNSFCDLPRAV